MSSGSPIGDISSVATLCRHVYTKWGGALGIEHPVSIELKALGEQLNRIEQEASDPLLKSTAWNPQVLLIIGDVYSTLEDLEIRLQESVSKAKGGRSSPHSNAFIRRTRWERNFLATLRSHQSSLATQITLMDRVESPTRASGGPFMQFFPSAPRADKDKAREREREREMDRKINLERERESRKMPTTLDSHEKPLHILHQKETIAAGTGQISRSITESHGNDDKEVWKQELLAKGFPNDMIHLQEQNIRSYAQDDGQRGLSEGPSKSPNRGPESSNQPQRAPFEIQDSEIRIITTSELSPEFGVWRLAPDALGNEIPPDAKWTRISRRLVSPEVLDQEGRRYEARPIVIAVLGVLSPEEIRSYVARSIELRNARTRRSDLLTPAGPLFPGESSTKRDLPKDEDSDLDSGKKPEYREATQSSFSDPFAAPVFFERTFPEYDNANEIQTFNDIDLHRATSPPATYDSDTASVISDNASIFSIESNSSWQSSVYDTLGAAQEFGLLLLNDEELKPLFNVARERIDAQKFKIELHGLLRIYSQNLRKEAESPLQKTAIQFVRKYRRKIAYRIGDDLFADTAVETPAENAVVVPHIPVQITESSDEDDGNDENEDFQFMKDFLVNSLAFGGLKKQLIKFLVTDTPLLLEPPDALVPKATTPHQPDNTADLEPPKSSSSEPSLPEGILRRDMVQESKSFYDDKGCEATDIFLPGSFPTEEFDISTSPDVTLNALAYFRWAYANVTRHLRKPSEPGFKRIEWTCDCGSFLYGDFYYDDAAEFEELANNLSDGHCQHPIGSKTRSGNTIPLAQLPSSSSMTSANARPSSLSTNNTTSQLHPLATQGSPIPPSNITPPIPRTPKYIALCVNKGQYYIALGEIEVSSITSDKEIFAQIKQKYSELRSFRARALRLFLIQPVDINFVHFAVEDSHRIDILSRTHPQNYPPKAVVEKKIYEYAPCPLTTYPAISANAFLHYMSCTHSEASLSRGKKWFNRLPKRLERGLEELRRSSNIEMDVTGWGIHIIEGPNVAAIAFLTSVVMVLCGIGSTVYGVVRKDVSGGFAIGAFVVAMWGSTMATLFFQWKQQ